MSLENIIRLTLELTNRCDLQCKICNIWKENKKNDLAFGSIIKITDSITNPLTIALTGGEPFLHPEFDKIYKYLFRSYLQKKILSINISTNAYSDKIKKFIVKNYNFLKPLSLSISLDGIGNTHNKQRGKKDAFEKTIKNITYVKKIGVPLRIKFTITPINYQELLKVYTLSKKLGAQFTTKLVESKNANYYHKQWQGYNRQFNQEQLKKISQDLNKIYLFEKRDSKMNALMIFALSSITKFIKQGNLNFINDCLTPKHYLFITPDGKIFSCLYYSSIGKIKNDKIAINNGLYKKILKEAKTGKCPKCLAYHGFLIGFNISKKEKLLRPASSKNH